MIKFSAAAAALTLFIGIAPAEAATLNFDDVGTVGTSSTPLSTYQGFTFTNVSAANGSNRTDGYGNGVVSAPNVIFNGSARIATISSASLFSLTSAYFTSAFFDQSATVIGYNGLNQVFSETFNILLSGPTLHSFNTTSIDRFTFRGNAGSQVVIDNLSIDTAAAAGVPEPATWAMMTLGFGAMGFAMRRKKVSTRIRFA
jgi:hypothetical protein